MRQELQFYSHVICLGTKIAMNFNDLQNSFYSHVICLGTKIDAVKVISED